MKKNAPNARLLNIKLVLLLAARVLGAAAIAIALASLCYEIVLRPQHAFYAQYWRFMKDDVAPSVIFFGDSRGVHALRHGSMDRNFFNYAHFGEYPFHQILRARHAMRDKPGVRSVVLQMDPYVVQKQRGYRPLPSSRGFYEALLYSSFADIREVVAPNDRELAHNVAAFVFPLMIWWERTDFWGAVRQLLTAAGLDNATARQRYFNVCGDLVNRFPPFGNQSAAARSEAARTEAAGRYRGNVLDPAIARLYKDFLAYARERGVAVLGIRLPETAEYSRAAEGLIDPAAMAFLDSLGIPILDYRSAFAGRPELFTDPDHLSDEGARLLSARVGEDVRRQLNLRPAQPWSCDSTQPMKVQIWPYELHLRRMTGI